MTYVHLGPIWYYSEPSDVPIAQTSFLVGTFFYSFLQQTGSSLLTSYLANKALGIKIFVDLLARILWTGQHFGGLWIF